MISLDLGCGRNKKKGFIGLDYKNFSKYYPRDEFIQHDLNNRLPFEDNSVDEIYIRETMEYIDNIFSFIKELHRVCRNGAKIYIRALHFTNHRVYGLHTRNFFGFYTIHFKPEKFELVSKEIKFEKRARFFYNYLVELIVNGCWFWGLYEQTFLKHLFPAYEIWFELKVIK